MNFIITASMYLKNYELLNNYISKIINLNYKIIIHDIFSVIIIIFIKHKFV